MNRHTAVQLLEEISTPEEREKLHKSEEARKRVMDLVNQIKPLQKEIEKPKNDNTQDQMRIMKRMIEVMSAGFEGLVSKMDEVKMVSATRKDSDFAPTLQNLAKSLADGFGSVKKSVDDKPVPVWKWPQYLQTGMRNTQFEPINPAIAPFDIDKYDDIKLTAYDVNGNPGVVTYYKNAVVTAVLTLTYDRSGNLTDAHRTT